MKQVRDGFVQRSCFTPTGRLQYQIRHELALLAARRSDIVSAILSVLPQLEKSWTLTTEWNFLSLYSDECAAKYPKNTDVFAEANIYQNIIDTYVSQIDFSVEWLRSKSLEHQRNICSSCVYATLNESILWKGLGAVCDRLEAENIFPADSADSLLHYAVLRTLQGKPWLCPGTRELGSLKPLFPKLAEAVGQTLRGEYHEAYDALQSAANQWTKEHSVRGFPFYPDLYGLMLYICRILLKQRLDSFLEETGKISLNIGGLKEGLGYACLQDIFRIKFQPGTALGIDEYCPSENVSVFTRILNFLVCMRSKNKDWVPACVALRDQYESFSPVIFNMLNDILRYVDATDKANIEGVEYVTWLDMGKGLERWELQMDSLKRLFGDTEKAPENGEKQRRLVWLIDFAGQTVYPYVQVRTAGGKWSQGQKFAIKRLRDDEPWLTPQDKDMFSAYEQDYQYYYSNTSFYFNAAKGFQILVDHPLLFDFRDRTPVKLELRTVELTVKEEDSRCMISLSARPVNNKNFFLKKIADGLWGLYIFDATVSSLSEILGPEGMEMPTSQLPEFLNVVQNLKKVSVNLQTKTQRLPGDPTPLVQLWQQGSTFLASLRVRPGGNEGTTYAPAEGKAEVIQVQNGRTVLYERDFAKESNCLRELLGLCPSLTDLDTNYDWVSPELTDFFRLITELKDSNAMEQHCRLEWPKGERFKLLGKVDKSQLSVRTMKSGEWFALSGEVKVNELKVLELTELLERSTGKSPFVQLKNGEFLQLSDEVKRSLERLRLLTAKRSGNERTIHPLAGALVEEICNEMHHESDSKWKDMIQRMRVAFEIKPPVPAGLQAELRPYQTTGYVWLCRLSEWGVGGCLADDMGLGKTIQAIAVMIREAQKGPCLIIAPTSVCPNWVEELNRFAPALQVVRLRDATDRKAMIDEMQAGMVMVAGYGLLPREEELFTTKQWRMVVFDEAQALKNSSTMRSRAAHKIPAHFPLALTGTPIENHLEDLWSVFNIINPGLLGTLPDFHRRFGDASEGGPSAAALKMLIRPFILRRLKSQVLDDLPELTEQTIVIEPTEKEAAFYESIRRNAVKNVSDGSNTKSRRFSILTELTRLRRACCHASLADPQAGALVEPISSKLTRFLELFDEAVSGGHRLLVFSQFVGHLTLVREELDKRHVVYQYLDGATPEEKRRESVAAFQRGEGDAFLISLKAGGQGLNLTAADIVVHLDPWWNPAVEDQATDRAYRIGQKNTVTVYRLVMAHSVEEKILKLHSSKRDLAADFLEGSEEAVTTATLSEEELMSLLQ
ncbi:MAG: DEAD/DEAH box helicase [Desulfovibrionaceae bacterium]|nr:DEAD/DEAH box helicase [Desulfovibrionaceae bacterium]